MTHVTCQKKKNAAWTLFVGYDVNLEDVLCGLLVYATIYVSKSTFGLAGENIFYLVVWDTQQVFRCDIIKFLCFLVGWLKEKKNNIFN